jgi:hypothetical protein
MRILEVEWLDGPRSRGGEVDAVAPSFRHPRVENTNIRPLPSKTSEPESPLADKEGAQSAEVSEGNIAPLVVGVHVKGLEYTNTLLHFGQLLSLGLHGCLGQVLALQLHLQLNYLPSQEVNVSSVTTNAGLDLIETVLELTECGRSKVLGRCTSSYLMVVSSRSTWHQLTQKTSMLGSPFLFLFSWKNSVTLS